MFGDKVPWYVVHVWDEKSVPADYIPVFESQIKSIAIKRARLEETKGYRVRVFQIECISQNQARVFEHPSVKHARARQFVQQYRQHHMDEDPPSRVIRHVLKSNLKG